MQAKTETSDEDDPTASSAKRRLQSFVSSIDHKLIAAFTTLLILYAFITVNALMRMPSVSDNNTQPFFEQNYVARSLKLPLTPDQVQREADTARASQLLQLKTKQYHKIDDIKDIDRLQHTFPVHVGDDMEEIQHPGVQFAIPLKMEKIIVQHDLPRTLKVPRFWRPTQYGPDGVRAFLGNYGERLMTPKEAAQIGSYVNDHETMYVSVASYRDPECTPTIIDLFDRAKYPERIRVAIIDQRTGDDPFCARPAQPCEENPDQTMCKFRHLIDIYEIAAPLSVGPVFARHLANRMYRGEYFAMQVDSHVRFIEDWDLDIISQWKSAENEMAVMTTYLSDINGSIAPVTHANIHKTRPIMCKTDYEGEGKLKHLRHGQQPEGIPGIHGEPTLHPFWAAGFSFARGHFVVQVPYDQYLPMVFQGEEISIGLRGFTYGYDYYTAETSVAFHMYAIKENKERRDKVKKFWENSNFYPGSAVEGMKRLNGIIGMGDPGDTFYEVEEKEFGLGHIRTKEKFFKLYGIHTDTKTVEDHLCRFVGKPMQAAFVPYLRDNRMGIDFSMIEYQYVDPDKGKPKAQHRH